jgi:hypothetical protein
LRPSKTQRVSAKISGATWSCSARMRRMFIAAGRTLSAVTTRVERVASARSRHDISQYVPTVLRLTALARRREIHAGEGRRTHHRSDRSSRPGSPL